MNRRQVRAIFEDEYGEELEVELFPDGMACIANYADNPVVLLSTQQREVLVRMLQAVPCE